MRHADFEVMFCQGFAPFKEMLAACHAIHVPDLLAAYHANVDHPEVSTAGDEEEEDTTRQPPVTLQTFKQLMLKLQRYQLAVAALSDEVSTLSSTRQIYLVLTFRYDRLGSNSHQQ